MGRPLLSFLSRLSSRCIPHVQPHGRARLLGRASSRNQIIAAIQALIQSKRKEGFTTTMTRNIPEQESIHKYVYRSSWMRSRIQSIKDYQAPRDPHEGWGRGAGCGISNIISRPTCQGRALSWDERSNTSGLELAGPIRLMSVIGGGIV